MKNIFIFIIELYRRFISPLFPSCCRFYPSCSTYAKQAFERFGFLKGFYITFFRIIRCNPLCKGGMDPVPDEFHWKIKKKNKI